MTPLPLNLLLFTSTAGHFGFYDIYQSTITHLERSLDGSLSLFASKIAHLKVRPRPEEEERVAAMEGWLVSKGFTVVITRGEWSRGMSHQNEYLRDIARVTDLAALQAAPFTLWLEDDSPIETVGGGDLTPLLSEGCNHLLNHHVLSYRFARLGSGESLTRVDSRVHVSPVFHFQPTLCRSRDLFLASNLIRLNWAQFSHMQCELAFTHAMRALGGEQSASLVCDPTVGYSHHLGGPDYPQLKAQLSL